LAHGLPLPGVKINNNVIQYGSGGGAIRLDFSALHVKDWSAMHYLTDLIALIQSH
jgi:hypothetical protein